MLIHTQGRGLQILAATALTTLAVACGSTAPTASPTASRPPTDAPTAVPSPTPTLEAPSPSPSSNPATAALLLEVTSEGGFISPSAHLGELPVVVVDTDGNIYTADPNATAALLIPQVVVRNVGPDGAAQILAAMHDASLDTEGDNGGVPGDTGVTVFTSEIDGQEFVNRITAGGPPGPPRPGQSPNPATDLLNRLLDPTDTWGATDPSSATFTPSAYKVYVAPTTATATTADWPLTASLADFGTPAQPDFGVTDLRTGAVLAADATMLASALGTTPAGTLITSDGQTYEVWVRPLLPPELGQ